MTILLVLLLSASLASALICYAGILVSSQQEEQDKRP